MDNNNEKLEKFPLQYNQMVVGGIMELNEITISEFEELLSSNFTLNTDYTTFIKHRDKEGHGSFILKRLTDAEFTL